MSFVDSIHASNLPAADTIAEDLPIFWWFNGDKRRNEPGVFYIKEDALWDAPGPPWQSSGRFHDESGFQAETLRIAVLGYRQQAFLTTSEDGRQSRQYLAEWVPGASFLNELLVMAEGLSEDSPAVWSCKGLIGKAVLGKGGLLPQYNTGLLAYARRLTRERHGVEAAKKIPSWAFWLPISCARDERGRILFTDTGFGSTVTLPQFHLPPVLTEETVEALYVGPERLQRFAELRADVEASGWFKRRRGVSVEQQDAQETPVTVPQAEPENDEDMNW